MEVEGRFTPNMDNRGWRRFASGNESIAKDGLPVLEAEVTAQI